MAKYAVTAANGQLGSRVVEQLVRLVGQDNVTALARTPSKAKRLNVEVRPGDYGNRKQLQDSLKGIDVVMLLSGMDAPEKRIPQHRNVIDAAKKSGCRKIVYTSIQGAEEGTGFSDVVSSNRQTEFDLRNSGLDWSIGRNGIYIEPDIEYIETYKELGEIVNCAGEGKCGYTTRDELASAYSKMLTDDSCNEQTLNLHGESITQAELADYLNAAFGTSLIFRDVPVEQYKKDRIAELGDFMGTVIAGIYEGIRIGAADNPSDFASAAGRKHQSWKDYFDDAIKSVKG